MEVFEDDNIDSCFLEDELDAMYKTSLAGLAVLLVSFLLFLVPFLHHLFTKLPVTLESWLCGPFFCETFLLHFQVGCTIYLS